LYPVPFVWIHDYISSPTHSSKSSAPPPLPPREEPVVAPTPEELPKPTTLPDVVLDPHIEALAFSFSKSLMLFPAAAAAAAEESPLAGFEDELLLLPNDILHKSSKLPLLLGFAPVETSDGVVAVLLLPI